MSDPIYDTLTRATLLGVAEDVREIFGDDYDEQIGRAAKVVEAAREMAVSRGVLDPLEAVRLAVNRTLEHSRNEVATYIVMAAGHEWLKKQDMKRMAAPY